MKLTEWIFDHPQIAIFVAAGVFFWIKERIFGAKKAKPPADEKWPGDDGEEVDWGESQQRRPPALPPARSGSPPPLNPQTALPTAFNREDMDRVVPSRQRLN